MGCLEEKDVPLVVGLLLFHLKFQTESLLPSSVYDKCCKIILETKGSTALGNALMSLVENELHPKRQVCVKKFFHYLWQIQNNRAVTELDSIALATRFGTFILRPPSGQEATLPRVKLMGALAVLIEHFPRTGGGPVSPVTGRTTPGVVAVASAGVVGRKSPSSSVDVATPPALRKEPVAIPTTSNNNNGMTIRAMPSLSVSGVQVGEVARSAIVVLDSSQVFFFLLLFLGFVVKFFLAVCRED